MMKTKNLLPMLAFAILIMLSACESEIPPEPPSSRPAKLFTVKVADSISERRYPAVVEANEEAKISFKVDGTIIELKVKQGQEVKKGDVIARLDPRDFELAVNQANSQLEEVQAQERAMKTGVRPEDIRILENSFQAAKTEFERDERFFLQRQGLVEAGAISREELQTAEAAYRVSKSKFETAVKELEKGKSGARKEDIDAIEARVRNLQESLRNAKNALADTILVAPYTARIVDKLVDNFEEVRSKQPIVLMQQIDFIKLAFGLPEQVVFNLKRGNIGTFSAVFNSMPDKSFPVSMHEFRLEADPKARTFTCRVTMPAMDTAIVLPGMTAEVIHREIYAEANGVLIPSSAVFADETNAQFVWKVHAPGMTVQKTAVVAGKMSGDDIWITSGLSEGDLIVTAGVNYLTDGMKVHRLEPRI
jgi:membrane fusion protein, multidrug efflux system